MVGVTLHSQTRMEVSGEIGQNHRMQPRDPWIYQDPQLMHIFGINQFSAQPIGGFKTGLKWTSKRVLTHRIHKTTLWRNLDLNFHGENQPCFCSLEDFRGLLLFRLHFPLPLSLSPLFFIFSFRIFPGYTLLFQVPFFISISFSLTINTR